MKLTHNFLILPSSSLDVHQLLLDFGRDSYVASKTIATTGISSIRYAYPMLLTDFIFAGLLSLNDRHNEIFDDIDAIVVVSQSYNQRIPSISTQIQSKFNLRSETFCVDIIDGCSGYIKALSIASMLESSGFKKVLIIAGDLNSVMMTNSDIGAKILFGDGISVSIVEADGSKIDTRLYNKGDLDNVISCSFSENVMHMNGLEVFRFARKVVPQMINTYLEESRTSLQSYDLVALHQASKLIVSTIYATLKYNNTLGDDFSCGEIGNLGAGSIGAWLSQIKNLDKKGELKMLAVGFGSGLSWGLASFIVNAQTNEVIYV
jgi:3-oxoacyl-[acyl-carrier-protein] synthase-3